MLERNIAHLLTRPMGRPPKRPKVFDQWTRLSCRRFKAIQTRLQLFSLAYNLANFLRQLVLPRAVKSWSLTTLREKLIKIGAKGVSHAKAVTFLSAEVAGPRGGSRRFWIGSTAYGRARKRLESVLWRMPAIFLGRERRRCGRLVAGQRRMGCRRC